MTTLWERLVDVLPELGPRLQQLRVNRARYRKIADTGKTADVVVGSGWGRAGAGMLCSLRFRCHGTSFLKRFCSWCNSMVRLGSTVPSQARVMAHRQRRSQSMSTSPIADVSIPSIVVAP